MARLQDDHRRGAVHVVVAVDQDFLAVANGAPQPLERRSPCRAARADRADRRAKGAENGARRRRPGNRGRRARAAAGRPMPSAAAKRCDSCGSSCREAASAPACAMPAQLLEIESAERTVIVFLAPAWAGARRSRRRCSGTPRTSRDAARRRTCAHGGRRPARASR